MNVKQKGTRGEHEIEKILQAYGIRAFRNDQIFRGGKENPDVSADLFGKSLHIEVKRVEKLNVSAAMDQAKRDAAENALPIVAHRRNREKWLITLPLVDLLDYLKEGGFLHGGGGEEGSGEGTEAGSKETEPPDCFE